MIARLTEAGADRWAVACGLHGCFFTLSRVLVRPPKPWLVCIHVEVIRVAVPRASSDFGGFAFCAPCRASFFGGGELDPEVIHPECGGCVLDRWPLEGAS